MFAQWIVSVVPNLPNSCVYAPVVFPIAKWLGVNHCSVQVFQGVPALLQMRRQLRDLVKFVDPQEQQIVYTNFEDELGEIVETDVPTKQTGFSPYQYRKKVEAYIRGHKNHRCDRQAYFFRADSC